jgi:phosphoserine phosphatase
MKVAFCFDLDGTLTQEEILPQIAKHVDLFEEIDLLTKITMRGLITFNKSFRLRVKLLSTIPISEVKKTVNRIRVDSNLQEFVRANKENCYIVTGNLDVWVDEFIKRQYDCAYFSSEAKYQEDSLLDVTKIIDKQDAITQLRNKYDFIVSIGDGMNDCSMFEKSDMGIAFGGVHNPVSTLINIADYVCYDSLSLKKLLESLNTKYSNENK